MKRTTTALSAFAAGAALLLAGCGSDTTGTAAPAAPASQASSAAAPTEMSDTGSSEAPTTDESSSSDDTSSDDTSSDDTSSDDTSSDDTSSDDTSSDDTSSDDSSSVNTAPTTTVGDGGDLDETSVTWFDTYCGGLAPAFEEIKGLTDSMGSAGSDPKKLLKTLSTTFTAMGKAFTGTAKSLDGVPVPTFDGGDVLASTVTKAMDEFGPKFTKLGTELAKADPEDPKSLEKLQNIGKDLKGVQELSKFAVDPETLAAIKKIPSCEPIFSMGG